MFESFLIQIQTTKSRLNDHHISNISIVRSNKDLQAAIRLTALVVTEIFDSTVYLIFTWFLDCYNHRKNDMVTPKYLR